MLLIKITIPTLKLNLLLIEEALLHEFIVSIVLLISIVIDIYYYLYSGEIYNYTN